MEATERLKMQRQLFDLQLAELPISLATIGHTLPLIVREWTFLTPALSKPF